MLDVFRFDPNFDENELLWEQIKKEILGDDDDEEDEEDGEGEDGEGGGQGGALCAASFSNSSITSLSLYICWVVIFLCRILSNYLIFLNFNEFTV